MKKFIIFLVFFLPAEIGISQSSYNDYNARYIKIIELIQEKDYYKSIKELDTFLTIYPKDAGMYFNRGLSKYYLNDMNAAKADFMQAKNLKIKGRKRFIGFMTSKDFLVHELAKEYLSEINLDSARDYKPVFSLKDSLRGALRPERTCFDVYFYDLTVRIKPLAKKIEGKTLIYFHTVSNTRIIQLDLAQNFKISSLSWQGKELKHKRIYDAIFIDFGEELQANRNIVISVEYSGKPRIAPNPPWNCGFVWKWKGLKHWIGVTCEQFGASSWWPNKDHLSDKPDSMRINVQVPGNYRAIANGNLRSIKKINGRYRNFEWFVSYPINNYNATFYMGNFVNFSDTFRNQNGSYPIDYYVLPQNLEKAKKFYSQTKDIVKVYEKLFGEYPFKRDGIGMVEAPYEGMEHQGAIAIGSDYGKTKRKNFRNTDFDYLVVHELAHEWWGNAIAVGDMADAWISEGFATYAENLFIEDRYGYNAYLNASANYMQYIFNIWPVVGIRDVNDNSFIGGDIYNKGAAMLNNLRCCINNDSLFFKIIKDFYNDYKYKITSTSDFINLVNDYAKHDYSDFFKKFLYETEPPVLQYDYTLKQDTLTFFYKWGNVGKNFTMPFSITLNKDSNVRLVASPKLQIFSTPNIHSFYLPNEKRITKEDKISKNSFTYFWTSWTEGKKIEDDE